MSVQTADGYQARQDCHDLVQEHPALYENHVGLAASLRTWAEDLRSEIGETAPRHLNEDDFLLGYVRALTDMAGHLEAGECLPGGAVGR